MGTEGLNKFTSVRPRDTVGTLAFLERGHDAARRSERIAWICAFVSLGLATLFAILWLACRFSDASPGNRSVATHMEVRQCRDTTPRSSSLWSSPGPHGHRWPTLF